MNITNFMKFIGSIKMAIPLLSAISIILIGATFYESQVGSNIVQNEVYKSLWFGILMFLLAVNLGVSAMSRYPWRGARKIGFALTHFGLIIIIAGSAAVIHLGVEGMLLVRTDAPGSNLIRVEGDLLEVIPPNQEFEQTDIFINSNSSIYPNSVAGISVLGYSENAIKTVSFTEGTTANNPAVLLSLNSNRMGQKLERWLAIAPTGYNQISLGPAQLEIVSVGNESDLDSLLSFAGETISDRQENIKFVANNESTNLDYFKVIVTDSGKLYFAANSSQGFKSGSWELGESITPGWADFQITLEKFIPHGKIQQEVTPISNLMGTGNPALLVETPGGKKSWLSWGEPTVIEDKMGEWLAAFSPKFLELPFAIKLEDFIVERNEGSDSVAMWTSKIRLEDFHEGLVSDRDVWMNHPTWYKGWKIAQASWNPGDLNQSTLQVKREPAWVTALTWTGSGLLVLGIGTMFYGPIIANKIR
ncbi:cytochrome c biogenesis protein ResB [Okeania sp.]|uniref:cytochrome c biogenesis protein ResB n=1 Tax=Okeania sp. TaxID=3100323 RepID=UPI002B4ACB37|nr:cytochrome c biogenesis protein ResB [Okeania sp.]MEB3342079.1 cytochrome c biogenesis protein ResB [Okeania sp.]